MGPVNCNRSAMCWSPEFESAWISCCVCCCCCLPLDASLSSFKRISEWKEVDESELKCNPGGRMRESVEGVIWEVSRVQRSRGERLVSDDFTLKESAISSGKDPRNLSNSKMSWSYGHRGIRSGHNENIDKFTLLFLSRSACSSSFNGWMHSKSGIHSQTNILWEKDTQEQGKRFRVESKSQSAHSYYVLYLAGFKRLENPTSANNTSSSSSSSHRGRSSTSSSTFIAMFVDDRIMKEMKARRNKLDSLELGSSLPRMEIQAEFQR